MILFIDIETVPIVEHFESLSARMQKHWKRKLPFLRLSEEQAGDINLAYRNHAGIYAEFSKVICIGLGYYHQKKKKIQTTVLADDDEKRLLIQLKETIVTFQAIDQLRFCGHNIKEFDLPFLCRRMTVHGLSLPTELNLAGLKPWENNHIDTMELWRFGDYKRFTSLDLLAEILGVPSSKSDIDGSMVADVFYEENNLQRIIDYCARDVVTTATIYYRLTNQQVEGVTIP